MNKENIGLLDSGVGGLSVLAELKKVMPNKNYIFFGDTKNLPYGTKTKEQIFSYTKEIMEYFLTRNVKNVVIACNTTSAVAYEELREYFKNKLQILPFKQWHLTEWYSYMMLRRILVRHGKVILKLEQSMLVLH